MLGFINYVDRILQSLDNGDYLIQAGAGLIRAVCTLSALSRLLAAGVLFFGLFTVKADFLTYLGMLLAILFAVAVAVIILRISHVRSRQVQQMSSDGTYTVLKVGARVVRAFGELSSLDLLTGVIGAMLFLAGNLQPTPQAISALALLVLFAVLSVVCLVSSYIIAALLSGFADTATSTLKMATRSEVF